jgi:hypothetical protein
LTGQAVDRARLPAVHWLAPFTPTVKRLLERSLREVLQLGDEHIGTEHVVLGLIREGKGVGAHVFTELWVDLQRLRSNVLVVMGAGVSDPEGGRVFGDLDWPSDTRSHPKATGSWYRHQNGSCPRTHS